VGQFGDSEEPFGAVSTTPPDVVGSRETDADAESSTAPELVIILAAMALALCAAALFAYARTKANDGDPVAKKSSTMVVNSAAFVPEPVEWRTDGREGGNRVRVVVNETYAGAGTLAISNYLAPTLTMSDLYAEVGAPEISHYLAPTPSDHYYPEAGGAVTKPAPKLRAAPYVPPSQPRDLYYETPSASTDLAGFANYAEADANNAGDATYADYAELGPASIPPSSDDAEHQEHAYALGAAGRPTSEHAYEYGEAGPTGNNLVYDSAAGTGATEDGAYSQQNVDYDVAKSSEN